MRFPPQGAIPRSLDDILSDEDDLGLLAGVKAAPEKKSVFTDAKIKNFKELEEFYYKNGREPNAEYGAAEGLLATRLRAYRENAGLRESVKAYDTCGLLNVPQPKEESVNKENAVSVAESKEDRSASATSLDDILDEDDDLNLLGDIDNSIYELKHIQEDQKPKTRAAAEEIADRKECPDFYRYGKMFEDMQRLFASKEVKPFRRVREENVVPGGMFILRGQLCYIESIVKSASDKSERDNPRMRVIFENGTESNLLKQTIVRALYKDKYSRFVDTGLTLFSNKSAQITSRDRVTGYIYILGSESKAPALQPYINAKMLVKIGYTTQSVYERIKNAENEATYLNAPVKVLATIECYNLNPQKFEDLIHAFLSQQRLALRTGKDGQVSHPREWFTVDYKTAIEVCKLIVSGEITQYRMDDAQGRLVKKKN